MMCQVGRHLSDAEDGFLRGKKYLLRKLQKGQSLEMPHSRPMPAIGERCHELRIFNIDAT
ncbi:MAG: hypothetical protein ABSC02_16195 [Acidobacteriota bacterium]